MKKVFLLFLLLSITTSCAEDNDDNALPNISVDFKFTHTWDDTPIDNTTLSSTTLTNENGETMTITRMRYLISRIELVDINGNSYSFSGYKFTDLSDTSSYDFSDANTSIPQGTYSLKFIWGFNEQDNMDGAYLDLNSASWNWPEMLGGGYHFLQLDGMYNVDTNPSPYNFHNGTARVSTNPNVFEQNFAEIEFSQDLVLSKNATVEVVMDISEFFKNPHTWNLNELDTPLMPNYQAQKMMQANVETVFSIGEIIED